MARTVAGTARSVLAWGREGGAGAVGARVAAPVWRPPGSAGSWGCGVGGRLPGTARRRRAGCAAEAAPSRRARRGAERTAPREGPARARSEWTGANRAGRAGSRDPGAGTARLLRSQDRPEGGGRLKSEPRAQLRAGRARGGVLIRATSGGGYPEPPGAPLPWRREPPPPPRVTVPLPERVRARRQGRGQTEGGGQRNLTPVGVGGQGDYLSPEEVRAARPAAWGRLQQSLLRPHPPRSAPTSRKV